MSHSGCALVWHVQPRVVIFPCRTHYRPSSVNCHCSSEPHSINSVDAVCRQWWINKRRGPVTDFHWLASVSALSFLQCLDTTGLATGRGTRENTCCYYSMYFNSTEFSSLFALCQVFCFAQQSNVVIKLVAWLKQPQKDWCNQLILSFSLCVCSPMIDISPTPSLQTSQNDILTHCVTESNINISRMQAKMNCCSE